MKNKHKGHILKTPTGVVTHVLCKPNLDEKAIAALCAMIDKVYQTEIKDTLPDGVVTKSTHA